MSLKKIQIVSDVSIEGVISYNITHNIGSLYATCTIEMLTTYALMIGDEIVLESEIFNVIQVQKKPHRRGQPRTVTLNCRSKADIFEQTTIDNDITFLSFIGLKHDKILYDGFNNPGDSPLHEGGIFKGAIMKAKRCGCFAEGGWTAHTILEDLISYTEIAEVKNSCMDYDIVSADFSAGMAVVDAARQLFGSFKPFIFAQAPAPTGDEEAKPTLYIIPTMDPVDYEWPEGAKINQDVIERKIDGQVKMVIIEGGVEAHPSLPDPCPPGCLSVDANKIINNLRSDTAQPLVDAAVFIDRTAYELSKDEGIE